jgi:hypothetical protein
VVDAAFSQRRKTLRQALADWAGSPTRAEGVLLAAGVDPGKRGEQLDVHDFSQNRKGGQQWPLSSNTTWRPLLAQPSDRHAARSFWHFATTPSRVFTILADHVSWQQDEEPRLVADKADEQLAFAFYDGSRVNFEFIALGGERVRV